MIRTTGRGKDDGRGLSRAALLPAGLLALGAILATGGGASVAAQGVIPVPVQSTPVVLRGGTIHTMSGEVIENGSIVFEAGVIRAIGTSVETPAGARVVDVTGKHLYPGLIDAYSTVGTSEIGAVEVSNDINELGDFNPNVRAEVAVNPESRHIGTSRSSGVLVTLTTPGGGLVSGFSSAMNLEGWSWEEMSLESTAALNVNWPNPNPPRFGGFGGFGGGANRGPSYAEQVTKIRDFFADARAYRDAAAAGNPVRTDSRYQAMIPALNGEVPVIVAAEGVAQINDAITWAQEEGLRVIIRGGRDADHVADRLREANIPVILTHTIDAPGRAWEGYDESYTLPARLHAAGVKFAIAGGGDALYTYRLPWRAGAAVAFGLPEEEAVKAVTLHPAQLLGIDDRVGSLEVGKDATLLITTGNPLDTTTDVEQVYIQGREVDMQDIQRWFFEKYMEKVEQHRVRTAM